MTLLDWSYPDDVDQSLEEEIDSRTPCDDFLGKSSRYVPVVTVASWAINGDIDDNMDERRLEAQKQALEEFPIETLGGIQGKCAADLFKTEEDERELGDRQGMATWMPMFDEMLENIERGQKYDIWD